MTKKDLLSIAAKVFGLVLIVHAIVSIPDTINMIALIRSERFIPEGMSRSAYSFFSLSNLIVMPLIFGLILILCSEGIAKVLVRENADAPLPDLTASPRPWFAIAARVVGLLAVVNGLPDLISSAIRAFAISSVDTTGLNPIDKLAVIMRDAVEKNTDQAVFNGIARLIIGVCLIWGGDRLSHWVFPKKHTRKSEVEQNA